MLIIYYAIANLYLLGYQATLYLWFDDDMIFLYHN